MATSLESPDGPDAFVRESADREPRLRAVQQRTLDTRAAILRCALAEFADRGFDGASTRGIAQRAGVNHTLIPHHFGNKDALWKATAEYVFSLYEQRLRETRQARPSDDRASELRALLEVFIRFSADVPELHRFMLQANRSDPDRLAWLSERYLSTDRGLASQIIEQAQREGFIVDAEPVHLTYALIGAATSIFALAGEYTLVAGEDPFDDETIDRHVDLIIRLFANPTPSG